MPNLSPNLALDRCPHCSIAKPMLLEMKKFELNNYANNFPRKWCVYRCTSCGGVISAWSLNWNLPVVEYFPSARTIPEEIPERPRHFLSQAEESIHAPAGAVMLAASAVDAMLKEKGYVEGSLYARIENAVAKHLITEDMSRWAHEIRLDANDQRHADKSASLPSMEDAKRTIDFALALAQILFVLPARVKRGLADASGKG